MGNRWGSGWPGRRRLLSMGCRPEVVCQLIHSQPVAPLCEQRKWGGIRAAIRLNILVPLLSLASGTIAKQLLLADGLGHRHDRSR